MYKKIVFFYPANNIGGAQILFCRVGEYLFENGFKIVNIDFGNSFITNCLKDNNVSFDHVVVDENPSTKSVISDSSIFVVTLSSLHLINNYFVFSDNVRFVFWDLHPNNLIEHTYFSFFYKKGLGERFDFIFKIIEKTRIKKLNNFLHVASLKKGLYFMCRRNYLTNSKFFNLKIDPIYVPISQPLEKKNISTVDYKVKNELHVGWLSRLDIDKVNILNLLVSDLDSFFRKEKGRHITLHVIGHGAAEEHILTSENITIIEAGKLYGDSLTDYLNDNVDIAFSMGTAALEFASRAIPTLLVPSATLYDYYKKVNKKYLWLYKVDGFDVATEGYHSCSAIDIRDIFLDIDRYGFEFLADKSYSYVYDNHSICKIGKNLISELSYCELSYEDIRGSGVYKSSFFDSVLSSLKFRMKKIVGRK